MFTNYLRTALRNLQRNKVYSSINVLGLSLGLAAAMLIMLYVKDEVSYDRFHKDVSQIFLIARKLNKPNNDIAYSGSTGYFQGPKFSAAIPEIQAAVRYQQAFRDLRKGTAIRSQEVYYTDKDFFTFFSFAVLRGDPATALQDPHSVVITEEMAEEQFGTTDAVGKTLLLKEDDQFIPYSVTAIAKDCPQNSSLKFKILLPLIVSAKNAQRNENWFNSFLNTFVKLSPDAKIPAVESKMKNVFLSDAAGSIKMIKEKYGVKDIGISHFLRGFTDLHLDTRLIFDGGITNMNRPVFSYILSAIALFILVIACINFVNLTMAQSLKRAKEIGIRKVIGSDRRQLIGQFLGESFLLSLAAFLFAIVLVQTVLPVFNHLSNKALSFSYLLDLRLITGFVALFLATAFLAGFYPALVLSGFNPVQTLYERNGPTGRNLLHRSLVIVQFTLASFLIMATLVIFSQFNYLTHEKLGYDDSNLVAVNINHWGIDLNKVQTIRDQLMKDPNILSVAAKNGGQWNTTVKVDGGAPVTFAYETIDENYLSILQIPVIKGRGVSSAYPADTLHSVLVNEAFSKAAGWKDPIGQQVSFYENNEKFTVVGVVRDYHFRPLTEKITPQLFTMRPENGYGSFLVKIRPNSGSASLQHIDRTFRSLFPLDPFTWSFKEEENKKNYEAEARWKQILLFGAMLTIFISCIGLFGLSVASAEKRRKEIGIRKVLGASVSGVVLILAKDFLRLVIIAIGVAIPLSRLAAAKWLANYPYRISLSWWLFAGASLLVILIAGVTISFQAIRAAAANPVKSLKTE